MRELAIGVFIFLVLSSPVEARKKLQNKCRAIDGDTIAYNDIKYRIYGVNTPERKKAGFKEATLFTKNFIGNCSNMNIEIVTRDRYNRTVAKISRNGQDLAKQLVRNKLAVVYWKYCKEKEYCNQLEKNTGITDGIK